MNSKTKIYEVVSIDIKQDIKNLFGLSANDKTIKEFKLEEGINTKKQTEKFINQFIESNHSKDIIYFVKLPKIIKVSDDVVVGAKVTKSIKLEKKSWVRSFEVTIIKDNEVKKFHYFDTRKEALNYSKELILSLDPKSVIEIKEVKKIKSLGRGVDIAIITPKIKKIKKEAHEYFVFIV